MELSMNSASCLCHQPLFSSSSGGAYPATLKCLGMPSVHARHPRSWLESCRKQVRNKSGCGV